MSSDTHRDPSYVLKGPLPALSPTHQRRRVESVAHPGGSYILSFCSRVQPANAGIIARQRELAAQLSTPPVALICPVVDSHFETNSQWTVSELPSDSSLAEKLQRHPALSLTETEACLRMLAEAVESAVSRAWPLLSLDVQHLYMDPRLGLPRIPSPDVPVFDSSSDSLLPTSSACYVRPLAILCCELLGYPHTAQSGNERYEAPRQLSPQQSTLLRRALTSDARGGFPNARYFINEFFGVPRFETETGLTGISRSLTRVAIPSGVTVNQQRSLESPPVPLPPPPASRLTKAAARAPSIMPLVISPTDREAAQSARPILRLRLLPSDERAPVLALVADRYLVLGRAASDADLITQFRPRSNINDGRSRRISRSQAILQVKRNTLHIEEPDVVNPSTAKEQTIHQRATLELPAYFILAGEYPVDVSPTPTDFPHGRTVEGWDAAEDQALDGGILVQPGGGGGYLPCEAAILRSDVTVQITSSGRPKLRIDPAAAPVARFHRLGGQFWLEAIEPVVTWQDGADAEGAFSRPLWLLRDGAKFQIGSYFYTVQHYSLEQINFSALD